MVYNDDIILVNIGEAKIVKDRGILAAYSLSSCVALMLYDIEKKIAGMSHVMLPKSNREIEYNEYPKFGDKAVDYMLNEMRKYGSNSDSIIAKIAGGSDVFTTGLISIGRRNVESVKNSLKNRGIRIVAEDVGGKILRTVFFNAANGIVTIKTPKYVIQI